MNFLKTIKWLFNIILIMVFTTVSMVFINGWLEKDNPRYVPGIGCYKVVSVLSDSMKPVMYAGDAIIVDRSKLTNLQKGDIITYWRANNARSLMTHRIVDTGKRNGEEVFYTRGDANDVVDGDPVSRDNIVGKYGFCIPYGGYCIGFLHTKAGFLLLIMFPVLLALGLEARKIYRESRAGWFKKKRNEPEMNDRRLDYVKK
ncbi:MAG: signal peptidase I [Clostridiales bacterium]|nr:signal peptidase I [Clostridiales bacterium]MCF8022577.1 signal peptidase I [Clostridiales bacterium]